MDLCILDLSQNMWSWNGKLPVLHKIFHSAGENSEEGFPVCEIHKPDDIMVHWLSQPGFGDNKFRRITNWRCASWKTWALTRQAIELHYGKCGIHCFEGLNHAINWKSGSQHFSPSSWKQCSELLWQLFIHTISQFKIMVFITDNYKIIISYNYSGSKNL